jgi:hypothetical protein
MRTMTGLTFRAYYAGRYLRTLRARSVTHARSMARRLWPDRYVELRRRRWPTPSGAVAR